MSFHNKTKETMRKIFLFLIPLFMLVKTAVATCAINPSDVRIDEPLRNRSGETIGVNVRVTVSDSEYNLHSERMINEARAIAKQAVHERFGKNYVTWSPSFQGPPSTTMEKVAYFTEKHWPSRNPKLDPFSEQRKHDITVDLKFWVPLTKP